MKRTELRIEPGARIVYFGREPHGADVETERARRSAELFRHSPTSERRVDARRREYVVLRDVPTELSLDHLDTRLAAKIRPLLYVRDSLDGHAHEPERRERRLVDGSNGAPRIGRWRRPGATARAEKENEPGESPCDRSAAIRLHVGLSRKSDEL